MIDTLGLVVFIVSFYFVFRFIWKNTTTISFSGMSGFFSSWLGQLVWAGFIAGVIAMIFLNVMNWLGNFLGENGGDILKVIVCGGVSYLLFGESNDSNNAATNTATNTGKQLFDKKTFMENYNRNVRELSQKENLSNYSASYAKGHAGAPLTLPEDDFMRSNSIDDVKIMNTPDFSISYSREGDKVLIWLFIHFEDAADNTPLESIVAKIAFTAAIESVAPGKSLSVESALNLIDSNGTFSLPRHASASDFSHDFEADGVKFSFSIKGSLMTLCFYK